jgi:hypothetical protein
MLKNLQSRNTLVQLANKFLTASIDSGIKNKPSKASQYEEQALAIADCLTHLEWLILSLEEESVKGLDRVRVIAIQEQEIINLKQQVERLNNEIQYRDL